MKYKSKMALIEDCQLEWSRLWAVVDSLDEKTINRRSGKGENARSIKDHLAHLHAWHRLLLGWFHEGEMGKPELPVSGFSWRQTPALNQILFEEFKDVSLKSIVRRLKLSHTRVLKIINGLSDKRLMSPGIFVWTGKLPLSSYVTPNMAGHYRWFRKKVRTAPTVGTKSSKRTN